MKKIKKALITLVAALTVATNVVGITACGGNGPQDVEVVAYDGSAVTITFSHSMGQGLQAAVEKYIPEFNKLYPNIKVKASKDASDYDTLRDQLSTKLNGKEEYIPSVAYCYPDHVALYNRGKKVVALDPYIENTEPVAGTDEIMGLTQAQIDDYYEVFYEEGQSYGDGKTYSLPFYKSTEVMYYNKDFFEANNLKVPTTWDEMETVCAQIKAIDNNCVPLGYDSEANWFITMTQQYDSGYTTTTEGNYFKFNNETNRNFVARFTDWYKKGYVTTKEIYENYTSNLFNETDASKLKCYMCIGSTGGATYQVGEKVNIGGELQYPFEVGVTQVPQVDVNKPKVIQQGPSICLFKKSNPQEVAAAWLFAKYFTTNVKFQAYSSIQNGYTPTVKAALTDPAYVNYINLLNAAEGKERNAYLTTAVVLQTIDQMDTYFTTPAFKGSSDTRTRVGALMQNCFVYASKKATEAEATKYIEEQFNQTTRELAEKYN